MQIVLSNLRYARRLLKAGTGVSVRAAARRSLHVLGIFVAVSSLNCGGLRPAVRTDYEARIAAEAIAALARESEPSIADLTENARGAVVTIQTPTTIGSGFHIGQGRIVTNFHVIEGTATAVARTATGLVLPVERVLAFDRERDVAIVDVDAGSMAALVRHPRAVRAGQTVIALGSPEGLEYTVTTGVISAVREDTDRHRRVLQHTAPISHGSSGGPLLDTHGGLVGMNTFIIAADGAQNLNFAVSIDHVFSLLERAQTPITLREFADATVASSQRAAASSSEQNIGASWNDLAVHSKACKLAHAPGCVSFDQGSGAAADAQVAARLYASACASDTDWAIVGCYKLGELYANGRGVQRNLAAARRLFGQSCRLGLAPACTKLEQFSNQ